MRNTEQRYEKFEASALFACRKTWLRLKKAAWRKAFHVSSTSRNPFANALFLLRLHAAVAVGCELHAQQPLVLAVVNLPAFRLRFLFARTRLNLFCLVFGTKFNILSALFVRQSFTLPQKNDSREGCC